jgi:hypothetical protein
MQRSKHEYGSWKAIKCTCRWHLEIKRRKHMIDIILTDDVTAVHMEIADVIRKGYIIWSWQMIWQLYTCNRRYYYFSTMYMRITDNMISQLYTCNSRYYYFSAMYMRIADNIISSLYTCNSRYYYFLNYVPGKKADITISFGFGNTYMDLFLAFP